MEKLERTTVQRCRHLEDQILSNSKKNGEDHDIIKDLIRLKTDMTSHEKLRSELLEFKISFDMDSDLKKQQMASVEDKVSAIYKKVDVMANESQMLSESSKIVKEAHK